MKLPELNEADRYVGLYVVDFGDHSSTGFTEREVAELLESEQCADAQVYKIVRVQPDGRMELKGVPRQTFQLEAGLFFDAADEATAREDYARLLAWATTQPAPARCKVHLAAAGDRCLTALIYPAEYDDAFSRWLLDGGYRTAGCVEGGVGVVEAYYDRQPTILQRDQLWPAAADGLAGEQLMAAARKTLAR